MENKAQADVYEKPETLDMQYARSAFLTGEYGHLAIGEMTDVIKAYNFGFHDAVRIREIDDRHNNVEQITEDAKLWNIHVQRMYDGYLAEMKSRGEQPRVSLEEFAVTAAHQIEHSPPPKIEHRQPELLSGDELPIGVYYCVLNNMWAYSEKPEDIESLRKIGVSPPQITAIEWRYRSKNATPSSMSELDMFIEFLVSDSPEDIREKMRERFRENYRDNVWPEKLVFAFEASKYRATINVLKAETAS